jgi:CheY-like chemotaxis protein
MSNANPVPGESTDEGLPKKVLVAEDNVVSQQVVKRYLEAIGCNVMVAEDGNAAVDACARQDFGLVLMDLQMPKMDGLTATREIRRRLAAIAANIESAALTAAMPELVAAVDTLRKAFDEATLHFGARIP